MKQSHGNATSKAVIVVVAIGAFAFFSFYLAKPLSNPTLQIAVPPPVTEKADKTNLQQVQPEEMIPPPPKDIDIPEVIFSSKNKVIVPYTSDPRHPNMKYITVYINDIPMTAIFDTGASKTVVNSRIFSRLSEVTSTVQAEVQTPAGPTTAHYFTARSIRIGAIEVNNVPCAHVPTSQENLLGGSFLNHFVYSIDESEQTITFIPKSERIRYTSQGIEPVPGSGWIEIDGKRYIYQDDKLVPEE